MSRGQGSYRQAPAWVEQTAPRKLRHDIPTLLLINMPQEECYVLATLEETNAIADPGSFLGRLLRPYSALMSVAYASNN